MSTPSELNALKQQLDNLLQDRLGQIAPEDSVEIEEIDDDIAQRPAPISQTMAGVRTPEDADDTRIMRKALDRIAGPFIVYGENYRIIFANQMARTLWPETIGGIESGLSIVEATANQIRTLMPTLSDQEVTGIAHETIAQYNSAEPNEVMASGGRWFRLHHDKVRGEYVCAMGVDITKLKRREAQLQEARQAADEANVAKSAFLARMSHEIKTPLNAIVGMSDALMEDINDPDTLETLEYIVTAAEGLTHVLGQTLDHAKLMSEKVALELQRHSMRDTIHKVTGMWKKPCAAKKIKLNIHVHQNMPEQLVFDRFRLQQCLNNLLSNAVKFTDAGHITVAAKIIEKPGKSPMVAIVVQDSGVGMREDARARIFNAYEQADKSTTRLFGGTGLGLSITKQLVEAMEGTITVQSEYSKGTAFLMMLPADLDANEEAIDAITGSLVDITKPEIVPEQRSALSVVEFEQPDSVTKSEPPSSDLVEKVENASPFEGLSVLCVEDNPVNHAVIKKLIGKQVKTISFANNGEEGLRALNSKSFDIVLMDIHMPIMDGIEATMKIRSSNKPWANVIIIAVTADPDFQYQRVCRNIGMNDAIGKPVRRQDILDSIARSLDVLKDTHAQRVELPIAV
jgi:signal transduction histidine kinase/AmiR/NasT family two-component response regulator